LHVNAEEPSDVSLALLVEDEIVELQLLQSFAADLALHEKLSPHDALIETVRFVNDFEKKAKAET